MGEDQKYCEHCHFLGPQSAEVCGHCGRNVAHLVTQADKSLKTRLYRKFIADGGRIRLGAAGVGFSWPGGVSGAIVFGVRGNSTVERTCANS